jgi:aconitate hydratase
MFLGVRAVIVKSFARIHKANLINYGIIPITFANPSDYDLISQDDVIEISNITSALENGTDFEITVTGKNGTNKIVGTNSLDERSRAILKAGGLASYTRMGGQ